MTAPTAEQPFAQASQPQFEMRIERVFIPMSDGVRLAANLYRPAGAGPEARFPALLEYLPYRKDDGTILDDIRRYDFFARRGYVGARVDVRGTGASEGVAEDEYSSQEGRDALDIVAWLAAQPWCNGNVGMWGLSYGGFNAIQTAILQPPALKAIIAIGATDDVYTDDITYWGGVLELESMGRWPPSIISSNAMPGYPDYDVASPGFQARFDAEPWILRWLRQQRDGPYWRRMSLRPHYEAVQIPSLLIVGWLDGYPDMVPRMLENMGPTTRAIVGPWPHGFPDEVSPGPRIDFKRQALRWWDHWLKGRDTGLMSEPRLAVYVQRHYRPGLNVLDIPGEWRYEDGWPVARLRTETWYPQPVGALARERQVDLTRQLEYRATVGTSNRYRLPHNPAELMGDQRADDAFSLSFTSEPLDEEVEILGCPRAVLHVSASAPRANWIVRLCDVAADGTSQLVSKGVLNGTHRQSHAAPQPLMEGETFELRLDMKFTSWVFAKGHCIRLAIANADFPNLWPSPLPVTTSLYVSNRHPSRVELPVCPAESRPTPPFRLPEEEVEALGQTPPQVDEWQVTRDEMRQTVTVHRESCFPEYAVPSPDVPIRVSYLEKRRCTASDVNPAQAEVVSEGHRTVKHGEDTLQVNARISLKSNEDAFFADIKLDLLKNGDLIRSRTWRESIPRDHA